MVEIHTHLAIDSALVGSPLRCQPGFAECSLTTTEAMAADRRGLVHGGFIFGLADYAAMLAVGDPLVVLGAAEVRFLAPVEVGDVVTAHASEHTDTTSVSSSKRRMVEVVATVNKRDVFHGTFTCFVLAEHVLDSVGQKEDA